MHLSSTSFLSTCFAGLLAIPSWQGAVASQLHINSIYTLTAIRPGDNSINNANLTATGEAFYIGSERVPCPIEIEPVDCPADHDTIVYIDNSTMLLESSGPITQSVYIAASGLLTYLISPVSELDAGSVDYGFSIQPSTQPGSAGNLIFKEKGAQSWMACADEDNGKLVSRVYANVTGITDDDVTNFVPTTVSQCARIDIALTPNNGQNFISLYPK